MEAQNHTALTSLEVEAAAARGGFACLFSNSDEFEQALIVRRRAEGRYRQSFRHWPVLMFVGCAMAVAGVVLLFH
ncbi:MULTISPECIES: hypothetical protein [unclassified Bradyrhizobium]|uniref:hypothetical protein n=1 Tax=unclassified Bradyrhizobium TaxID=2631580 RepID=UPI0028E7F569|nr:MULTISPECIES: hypothetical protein [unclassified Bradyrhizobium]